MKRICVIGSINMDLVTVTPRFPRPGETLTGDSFGTFPGGKGANQAVAAGRLGADVTMVGKLGDDSFGSQYRKALREAGVKLDGVGEVPATSTGLAIIEVDRSGENHIIIIAGANALMTPEVIDASSSIIERSDIVLLQLEIPIETVEAAAARAHEMGRTVILDPAPARELPASIYGNVDYITPNETEIEILTGIKVETADGAGRAGQALRSRGVGTAVIKAGSHGAFVVTAKGVEQVEGFSVDVVDTTAAGDAFNGGLAVALARDYELVRAVRFANAVGALSTTAGGAQTAMPASDAVDRLLAGQ